MEICDRIRTNHTDSHLINTFRKLCRDGSLKEKILIHLEDLANWHEDTGMSYLAGNMFTYEMNIYRLQKKVQRLDYYYGSMDRSLLDLMWNRNVICLPSVTMRGVWRVS